MNSLRYYITNTFFITIFISTLVFLYLQLEYRSEEMTRLNKTIALQQQQLEAFIADASSTVDQLALMTSLTNDKELLETSLAQLIQTEPKYRTIMILDKNANVTASTNPALIHNKIKSFNYFTQSMNKNNIFISVTEKDMNGLDVIYMSKLIFYNNEPKIVVLEMDVNSILSIMDVIHPEHRLKLTDVNNRLIFMSKQPPKSDLVRQTQFQNVPWVLTIASSRPVLWYAFKDAMIVFIVVGLFTALYHFYRPFLQLEEEKKQLQDHINAQKKELIGMLAANTAHEIKNPLTSVMGFVKLIQMKYDPNSQNEYFYIVNDELGRINDIVNQFLLLGKPTTIAEHPVNVVAVVQHVLTLLRFDINEQNVKIISKYPEGRPHVLMSEDQLKQVMINLLQNARDAVIHKDKGIIEVKVYCENNYVFITVRDNGVGIDESTLQLLFEPFYTTKNSGTGLGLPVSKNIIEIAGGTLTVDSIQGIGTTFIIQLDNVEL